MVSDLKEQRFLQKALSDINKMVSNLKVHTPSAQSFNLSPSNFNLSIPGNEIPNPRLSENFSNTDFFIDFRARYDSLNREQRQCLLYFSIFPESSIIRKKVLTYLLIGEGFRDSTTTGDGLFEELATKGFIEPVEEKGIGDFKSCKINPPIRSKLISLARDADFFDFDSNNNPTVDFTRSSRACLLKEGSLQQLSTKVNHEKLEVLFNVGESYLDFPSECFSKMKKMVVLHLGNWSCSGDNIIKADGAALLESLSDVRRLNPRTKDQCTLSDLEKLEKLRKLGLYADRKTTGEKGELNCLSNFKVLRILTISWTIVSSESKSGKGVVHKILANTKKHNRAV
ncbi:Disease resistance RPP13-like protein 4 [Camellia lanceoleosa]|uniref:Disease resistance RPP13-like protein 4 n=1 Tax=Camellia lanceoleosa TaxID=1840588 RepID=A0ACC0IJR3_9ERIC|nr:Disease resistance RPP13-like protein 4 [Camellia lanceoleosa]